MFHLKMDTEKQIDWLEKFIRQWNHLTRDELNTTALDLSTRYDQFLEVNGLPKKSAEEVLHELKFPDGKYWTYEIDGNDEDDTEYPTADKALEAAVVAYNIQCSEGDDYKDAQQRDVYLRQYGVDDDGDSELITQVDKTVEYEYERSDAEEHSTLYRGGGGVL